MNYRKLTNRELIELCTSNPPNQRAWVEFVRRFDEFIYTVALRECRDRISKREKNQLAEIIQDRVSEVYFKLVDKEFKALRDFVGTNENAIYAYLTVIMRNIVLNWVTREKRTEKRPPIDKSLDELLEQTPYWELCNRLAAGQNLLDIEDQEILDDLKRKINSILNKFTRGKKKVRNKVIFKLYFYEGLSAQEIVDALPGALALKTVENILTTLKKMVQDGLSDEQRESG